MAETACLFCGNPKEYHPHALTYPVDAGDDTPAEGFLPEDGRNVTCRGVFDVGA